MNLQPQGTASRCPYCGHPLIRDWSRPIVAWVCERRASCGYVEPPEGANRPGVTNMPPLGKGDDR